MERKDRRELKSRQSAWAQKLASRLASMKVTPNAISLASIFFAFLALLLFLSIRYEIVPRVGALLAAALCIQLRLICNLLDGLVAIEHKAKTPTGDLYNEVPDRWADSFFIVGAGYALTLPHAAELGWAAALLALLTAYTRTLGRSLGSPSYFIGPMAKQHRMFILTLALVVAAALPQELGDLVLFVALVLIAIGSLVTSIRRLLFVARDLKQGAHQK